MKITETQLKNIITEVMNEMHHEMPGEMPGEIMMSLSDNLDHSIKQKAEACMVMDAQKLFMMCTMICSQNPEMAMHCKRLCKCICDGDFEGCCECLSQICGCQECSNICSICCKC